VIEAPNNTHGKSIFAIVRAVLSATPEEVTRIAIYFTALRSMNERMKAANLRILARD
jgi:hypothetical protein